jgi:hypothetical protein
MALLGNLGLRPHLLEIVEFPNLGLEQVNDDVADIDQNPVALFFAFDANPAQSRFLQLAVQLIGQRADVPIGSAGCDNHMVAERGFSFQVDGNHVLGFAVVEYGEYEFET